MNRRSAISVVLGLMVTTVVGASSWKMWNILKVPDLSLLSTKKQLIAEIADTIIPATNTPGAKAAQVEDFIILMVKEGLEVKSQNNFINGLTDLETYTLNRYNRSYKECTRLERESILNYYEDTSASTAFIQKVKSRLIGESFMDLFKRLTIAGFYTSEVGAMEALTYSVWPSTYKSHIHYIPSEELSANYKDDL